MTMPGRAADREERLRPAVRAGHGVGRAGGAPAGGRLPASSSARSSRASPPPASAVSDVKGTRHARPRLRRRGGAPTDLRLVRRAHGPVRLHRHLRARPPDRRRAGLPPRRPGPRRRSWAPPSSATPAATSSPGTRGRTASAREQAASARPGAWHTIETNAFGLHEFIDWSRVAGVEVMQAVNLGTRGVEEARELVEYANHPGGTDLSDRAAQERRTTTRSTSRCGAWATRWTARGRSAHKTADEYGRLAAEAAKAMRLVDPSIELVACGSSNSAMPTFGAWEQTVLGHTYDRSTTSRCTPTTRSSTGTTRASWPARSTWTTSSSRWSPPPMPCGRKGEAQEATSTSPSTSGTSGTSPAGTPRTSRTSSRRPACRGAPAAHRGRVLGDRRRRRRHPAQLAAAARRPRADRQPGPAGQRHRPDPHRGRADRRGGRRPSTHSR